MFIMYKKFLLIVLILSFFSSGAHAIICSSLLPYNGTSNDASSAIITCIDNTPAGGVLELPAGRYFLSHQINITKSLKLSTEGKTPEMARCRYGHQDDCAQLVAAIDFDDQNGIIALLPRAEGSQIDHIVVDGNKDGRYAAKSFAYYQCANGNLTARNNRYGMNYWIQCNNCTLTNSLSINALCGTGVQEFGGVMNMNVSRNLIAYNGMHPDYSYDVNNPPGVLPHPVSDGLTVMKCGNCSITDNEFYDNTDIDLIFGACDNCIIQNNTIGHSGVWQGSSSTALSLYHWSWEGNYSGTIVSGNKIDCGENRGCGFGIQMGPDPWMDAGSPGDMKIYGASVHDNTVTNAIQGINIDDVHDFEVYRNTVTSSGGIFLERGKTFWCLGSGGPASINTSSYNIGNNSYNIDTSKDSPRPNYTSQDWDHCLAPSAVNKSSTSYNWARFISQDVPIKMAAGKSYDVYLTMKNSGWSAWTYAADYRIGSQSPQDNSIWNISRGGLSNDDRIEPYDDSVKTFALTVAAPAAPGNYSFQWRMLQEGVEWFGEYTENLTIRVISSLANDAEYVNHSVPSTMTAGRTYNASVSFRNTGSAAWSESTQHRLGSENPRDNHIWNGGRAGLIGSEYIPPGAIKTFTLSVSAPVTPGTYDFQWRMLQEGVEWFGEYMPNQKIIVVSSTTSTTTTTTTTTSSTTTTSTTTSTSTTSTTTTTQPCALTGNYPPCDVISLSEVVDAINRWVVNEFALADVIHLINAWASG
jgi:hypothetical protein